MLDAVRALKEVVHAQASRSVWSQGVNVAKEGEFTTLTLEEDEVEIRVGHPAYPLASVVSLYPLDDEWDCDCSSRDDPCEHVAAAVIAYVAADGDFSSTPSSRAHVGYRLITEDRAVVFSRVRVAQDGETPIRHSIALALAGKVRAEPVDAESQDIDVDQVLEGRYGGRIPRTLVPKLFKAMATCRDVTLDGRAVRIASRPLLPRAKITATADGYRLELRPDPELEQVFANGIGRSGDTLRPVGEAGLSREEVRRYSQGVVFDEGRLSELLEDIVPDLKRRIHVEMPETSLPELEDAALSIRIQTSRHAGALAVTADLVYGDPPLARVGADGFEMVSDRMPRRDSAREDVLQARLLRELGLRVGQPLVLEGGEAVRFVARLDRFDGALDGDAHRSFQTISPLVPKLLVDGTRFDVTFETARGAVAPQVVFEAWRKGEPLVPCEGEGWAPLPEDWLRHHGAIVEELFDARTPTGEIPFAATPDLSRLCERLAIAKPEGLDALAQNFAGISEASLPSDLTATLRDYQREGVNWLAFHQAQGLGALLADDMGLGKTLQAICVLEGRSLVVAPTSVLPNWQREIERFRPSLNVSMYHGSNRRWNGDADIVLTSYALLRLEQERFSGEQWAAMVLDEAQAIKNPQSQVAQAAYTIPARFRLALTGTPIENRLEELWSQFHFLNPGLLGTARGFKHRYVKPISGGAQGELQRLRTRLHPFILRRLKVDVAEELPPKTEVLRYATLSDEERVLYDAIRISTRKDVAQALSGGKGAFAALEALLRLRQSACHSALIPGQEREGSAKTSLLVEMLQELVAEGHKALVFSQWTGFLDLIEPHLNAAAIGFNRLDGQSRDRAGIVGEFQSPAGPPVLLISLKAGGVGLNLTAADHVFIMDPWWNPAVEDQAADRAYRIGQERPVFVHRIVAKDTVEEGIVALQEAKRSLAQSAIGGGGAGMGLTQEDLLGLLQH